MKKIRKTTLYAFLFAIGTCFTSLMAQNTFPASGNVGIGTSSPSSALSVLGPNNTGNLKIGSTSNNSGDTWWMGFSHGNNTTDANDRARIGVNIMSGGAGRLYFSTGTSANQSEKMRIDENGNVGIGTTTPSVLLDVYNVTANARTSVFTRGQDPNYQIGFQNGSGNNVNDIVGKLALTYNGSSNSSINFHRGIYSNAGFISITTQNSTVPDMVIGSSGATYFGYSINDGDALFARNVWAKYFFNTGVNIGNDNASSTAKFLDVHGHATFNNDLGSSDATMTHVTINTDTSVAGTALTVAGPTYIGDWKAIESGAINSSYFSTYNLWVTKGVVSNDFAIATESEWKDDVFEKDYKLPTLKEVENFITTNKHLPDVPSAEDVKNNGYTVRDMTRTLLQKVEELTLYTIALEKKLEKLNSQVNSSK